MLVLEVSGVKAPYCLLLLFSISCFVLLLFFSFPLFFLSSYCYEITFR